MLKFTEKGLEVGTASRLKWKVCTALGICPGSAQWRRMTRHEVLEFAAQLALDLSECSESETPGANPNFDTDRFNRLREGIEC